MQEEFDGKPQRSDDAIRDSLQKIHRTSVGATEPGALNEGMQQFDPLLISLFHSDETIRACQHELRSAGIFTQHRRKNGRHALYVDYQDRAAAGEIIDHFRASHDDFQDIRLKWDYALLGAILGVCLGAIPILVTHRIEALGIAVGTALMGTMLGLSLDRLRWRRKIGKSQRFGLFDTFLAMAIIALGISLPELWAFILRN